MKDYKEPVIEEEVIELSDIIAVSNGGETSGGIFASLSDIFGGAKK